MVPPGGEYFTALEMKLAKTWSMRARLTSTRGRCGSISTFSFKPAGDDEFPLALGDFLDKLLAGNGLLLDQGRAAFEAGQVQQILDHLKEAIGIVPRGEEQLGLLGIERADFFLQQQIDRHLHAGQRRFELVADRGDQVGLHIVGHAEAGDILQAPRTTPTGVPLSLRMARTRGRKNFSPPSRFTRMALSKLVG